MLCTWFPSNFPVENFQKSCTLLMCLWKVIFPQRFVKPCIMTPYVQNVIIVHTFERSVCWHKKLMPWGMFGTGNDYIALWTLACISVVCFMTMVRLFSEWWIFKFHAFCHYWIITCKLRTKADAEKVLILGPLLRMSPTSVAMVSDYSDQDCGFIFQPWQLHLNGSKMQKYPSTDIIVNV